MRRVALVASLCASCTSGGGGTDAGVDAKADAIPIGAPCDDASACGLGNVCVYTSDTFGHCGAATSTCQVRFDCDQVDFYCLCDGGITSLCSSLNWSYAAVASKCPPPPPDAGADADPASYCQCGDAN